MGLFSVFKKSGPEKQKPTTISFLFHLVTISITCAIVFKLIQITVNQPTPTETMYSIKALTPQKVDETANVSAVVQVGLSVYTFKEFDVLNGNFVFEGSLWFEFDPAIISLDTVSNFVFQKAEILLISAPKTKLIGKKLRVVYELTLKFKPELNYRLFPLDDHLISLVMYNKKSSPQEILFQLDKPSFVVKAPVTAFGWVQSDTQVSAGYIEENLDERDTHMNVEHPAVQFSILYHRSGMKYALIILLPMVVFIIVMLTSFSYDPNKYFSSIMVANGAGLSGLIAFRFIIENMSPKVGYFMISDYFFLVFLSMAAILFLISIFSLNLSVRTKKNLILVVHMLLITAFVIIVWYELGFTYHGVQLF